MRRGGPNGWRASATPAERALIEAHARRYSTDAKADRAALDAAYADAMLAPRRRIRANDDLAVLAAEAAMDTLPWDYWEADGRTPKPRLGEAVEAGRERARAQSRSSAGGASLHPFDGRRARSPPRRSRRRPAGARRSSRRAGHLVHMPAHIYFRLGPLEGFASRVNVDAARADEAYIRAADDAAGPLRLLSAQRPFHRHLGADGGRHGAPRSREARRLATIVDPATAAKIAWIQAIHAAPYIAAAQFALAERNPGAGAARRAAALCRGDALLCARRGPRAAAQPARVRARDRGAAARSARSAASSRWSIRACPRPICCSSPNGRARGR